MSAGYDLFISYRRKDQKDVDALVEVIEAEGLACWVNRKEIEDAASIQRRINEGLAQSRSLLAYYSTNYPRSRTWQWGLTAALIAAGTEKEPVHRILVVNPDTPRSMNNLTGTLRDQGDLSGARSYQEKVFDVSYRILGEYLPASLTNAWNLYRNLDDIGEYDQAQALLNKHLIPLLENDPAEIGAVV